MPEKGSNQTTVREFPAPAFNPSGEKTAIVSFIYSTRNGAALSTHLVAAEQLLFNSAVSS
jgi:hypothetical protein